MEEIKSPLSLENFSIFDETMPCKHNSSYYKFHQRFGDRKYFYTDDDDIITSLSFDKTGSHLAVGDKAGRIVVFRYYTKYDEPNEEELTTDHFSSFQISNSICASAQTSSCEKRNCMSFDYDAQDITEEYEYEYIHDFQSHEKDMDYLKNQEIMPQINNIKWLHPNGKELSLIACNNKCIKLWKIKEGTRKDSCSFDNVSKFSSKMKQSFFKLHDYTINSLSVPKNEEIFITSDDLKINLWDLNEPNKPYNLIDMTPFDLDDLSEVITNCNFHPLYDNLFVFSSSEGNIRVADLRKTGVCDKNCLTLKHNKEIYKDYEDYAAIIRSISNCQFTTEDNKIIARDYMNIFIWDIRSEKAPIQIIPIFEPLKTKLGYLFKNEKIFDQFSMSIHPGQKKVLTGNYDDSFHLIDLDSQQNTKYKLLENDEVKYTNVNANNENYKENWKEWDFENKVLKTEFSPDNNCMAVACQNCLYLLKK